MLQQGVEGRQLALRPSHNLQLAAGALQVLQARSQLARSFLDRQMEDLRGHTCMSESSADGWSGGARHSQNVRAEYARKPV